MTIERPFGTGIEINEQLILNDIDDFIKIQTDNYELNIIEKEQLIIIDSVFENNLCKKYTIIKTDNELLLKENK